MIPNTNVDIEQDKNKKKRFYNWVYILFAIGGLALFMYVIGPLGLNTKALKPMADFIEKNDINANAYYYTEVDEFFESERHMRDYLKLVPGSNQ
jgi:uncharacterized membrane protein